MEQSQEPRRPIQDQDMLGEELPGSPATSYLIAVTTLQLLKYTTFILL